MSRDALSIFQCYVCRDQFPSIHRHTHHKVPQSLGGKDTPDNLVDLCPQCHDLLHSIAYKLVSKKYSISFLEDMSKMVYKGDMSAVQRSMGLSVLVRDEIITAKETEKSPNEFVDVYVRVKHKHKKKLHEWAKANGTSLEDMVRNILFKALSDKYNMSIDHKAESTAVRLNKKTGNQ